MEFLNFKISKTSIIPLDDTFINDIKKIDKKSSYDNILEILLSKNIYLSNNIIEIIQKSETGVEPKWKSSLCICII